MPQEIIPPFPAFDSYVCDGDSVTVEYDGFTLTAHTERDDDCSAPDERQDGYWPSLDPESDGYIGPKSKSTLRRHTASATAIMEAWKRDEWDYCGVCVTVTRHGVELCPPYRAALWSVERNYPGKSGNAYLNQVADELADEALSIARAKLAELCRCGEVAA